MVAPPLLEVEDARVTYGTVVAVGGVSLTIAAGERLALLGPSGSGKSTLMRAICGLEPLAAGRVLWQGRDLASVPVHERRFGLMFQDYVLFPQRDVRGNVRFGLEMHGGARDAIDARVDEVLALVGLSGYGSRRITQLSGGEQQRVALARSLAPGPRLLMLDEPLGALDRVLRGDLLDELIALFERLDTPVLYVTHDQEEAFAVAHRVVIMREGRAAATGTPTDLWSRPPDAWTARFLGFRNVAEADIRDGVAQTPWGPIALPGLPADARVELVLRPEGLTLAASGPIRGTVDARRFERDHERVIINTLPSGAPLELEVRGAPVPEIGQSVAVAVDPERVNVLR